jgi:hypothetical protein
LEDKSKVKRNKDRARKEDVKKGKRSEIKNEERRGEK